MESSRNLYAKKYVPKKLETKDEVAKKQESVQASDSLMRESEKAAKKPKIKKSNTVKKTMRK